MIAFLSDILTAWTWTLDALDRHGGAITAIFTIVLAISTILLWWATRGLRVDALETIEATKKTAQAALDANDLQRRDLVANYRPWVSIKLTGPYRFFRGNEDAFVLTFHYMLKNEGVSAAKAVGLHCQITLDTDSISKIHEAHSSRIRTANLGVGLKVSIRPDMTTEGEESVALNVSELRKRRPDTSGVFTFTPILVGTVFYYSAFSDEPLETRFATFVSKVGGYDPSADRIPQEPLRTDDREVTNLIFQRIASVESFE